MVYVNLWWWILAMEELTHLILKHSCTHYLNILDSVLPFQNWRNNFWEDLYKISEVQAKGLMLSKDSGESHFQQIWHKSGCRYRRTALPPTDRSKQQIDYCVSRGLAFEHSFTSAVSSQGELYLDPSSFCWLLSSPSPGLRHFLTASLVPHLPHHRVLHFPLPSSHKCDSVGAHLHNSDKSLNQDPQLNYICRDAISIPRRQQDQNLDI